MNHYPLADGIKLKSIPICLFFLVVILGVHGQYLCDEAFDPVCSPGKSFQSSSGTTECLGYFSCYDAVLVRSQNNYNVWCLGSFSCFGSDQVRYVSSGNDAGVLCGGLMGCGYVGDIANDLGSIDCLADRACAYSTVRQLRARTFSCGGGLSCSNSQLNVARTSYHAGYLAAYNSSLVAADGNGWSPSYTDTYLNGGLAAYNGTFECQFDGRSCEIYCNTNNACTNLNLTCDNGNINDCIFEIFCNGNPNQVIYNGSLDDINSVADICWNEYQIETKYLDMLNISSDQSSEIS